MKAVRPYEDSAVRKVLDMMENATAGKAAPEKFITKFARLYTPIVCGLALLLAVAAPLVSGLIVEERLFFNDFPRWLQSALTFLVVSCPCALIISVPLTYFTGIGVCAKKGILVKGATYLDTAARIKAVAFDKTGTLTEGNFTVCGVHATSVTNSELLAVVAAIEKNSSHPIARAFSIVDSSDYIVDNVTEISGQGLCATVGENTVLVGNERLLKKRGVNTPACESIYTVVHVAKEGEYWGWIEVGDRLKAEAHSAVQELKSLGIQRFVVLTGDRYERAQKIANEVGVYEVKAQLLPDEKLLYIEELKKDGLVMYVGDGVNDAPVMSVADCSVSMGTLGSAAAVEASDFVLISDDLKGLGECVRTAKRTRSIVMQNILFSIAMKTAFMVLGAAGVLPLWLAVFADVGVMLLAVLNSFRVHLKEKKHA
jgi:Cd2+/Zn2+-exporting ATPase